MATGDVVRLDLHHTYNGELVTNSLHFTYETNDAEDADLIDKWQAACQSSWLAIFFTPFTLADITATQVYPCSGDLRGSAIEVVGTAGSRSDSGGGTLNPAWLAADVRITTAVRGRTRQGRFFPWVPSEVDFTVDVLQSSYLTKLDTYLENLFTAFGSGGTDGDYRFGVFSRSTAYDLTAHPPTCVPGTTISDVFRECTSIGCTGVLTTQRSRRST